MLEGDLWLIHLLITSCSATGHSAILLDALGPDMLDERDGEDVIVHAPSRKAFCLSVLNWLPSAAVGEQAMEYFIRENCWEYTLPPVALRRFYSLLWSTFGDQLKRPRRQGKLAVICEVC